MGRKFASLHVFGTDKVTVMNCLAACLNESAKELPDTDLMEVFADKDEIASFVKALKGAASQSTVDFYITANCDWVSIFSEHFSFETVTDCAFQYFGGLSNPVITVGYFDDDLLKIDCVSEGAVVTGLVKGPRLKAYGLKAADMDLALFSILFRADATKAAEVFAKKDIDAICDALGDMLNIPLQLERVSFIV